MIAHSQDGGFCSIIGGYVIRDRALGRGWNGRYVYGDYCNSGCVSPARGGQRADARHRLCACRGSFRSVRTDAAAYTPSR